MKRNILFGAFALLAGSLFAADSSSKDEVKSAANKLAEKGNYSWKTTVAVEGGGGGRFRPGPIEGKTEKDGFTLLTLTQGDNSMEAVLKGGKGALKTEDGWKSLSEAAQDDGGGGFNPARFMAMRLQNFKTPAAEAADMTGKVNGLKLADGVYAGDLTEDGAKQLLTFRRPGGDGPEISGAKGSAKFWVNEGLLSKCEYHVEGTVSFNGNDRQVNRTTTVEIKDVGTTKVSVPEDAAKKAS
jgi:hypothetical protein